MPSKSFYIDDETYKKVEALAVTRGESPGHILSEWVRVEVGKSETDEQRPKTCGTPECGGRLIANLGPGTMAQLYLVCDRCRWQWDSKEFYKTEIWHD